MAATNWNINVNYSGGAWTPTVRYGATAPSDGTVQTLEMVENTNAGSASTSSARINTALYAAMKTILNARADGG